MAMTRFSTVLVSFVACWLLGTQAASAAGDKVGTISVSVIGGPAIVTTDSLKDVYDIGWSLEARVAYTLSPNFAVVPLRGHIARFSTADDAPPGAEKLSVSSFVPSVLISLDNEQNVNPYLLVGGGLYHHNAESDATDLGIDVGAGVEFAIGSAAALDFEARLSMIQDVEIEFAPIINFGFTYYFGEN
jgi:hypothetical protein